MRSTVSTLATLAVLAAGVGVSACDGAAPDADASALRACEAILPAAAVVDACGVTPVWIDPDVAEWHEAGVACARWMPVGEPAADADGVRVELTVHGDAATARGHLQTRLAELGGGSPRAGRAPGLTAVDDAPDLGDGGVRIALQGLETDVDDRAGRRHTTWTATGALFTVGRVTGMVLAKDHDNGRVDGACDAQGVEALTAHLLDAIVDPPDGASAVPDDQPPPLDATAVLGPDAVATACHADLPKADEALPAGTSWSQAIGDATVTVRVTRLGSAEAAAATLYDLNVGLLGDAAPLAVDGIGDAAFATTRQVDGHAVTTTCGRAGPVVIEVEQAADTAAAVPCGAADAEALLAAGLDAAMHQLADGYAPQGPEDVQVPVN
ncbi:MAG: hypothetical protein H6733_12085 [Alphaproteobacteria bacterium]|nr:hypothetical protein [Alphaproteobacteria bacterium]